MLNGRTFLSSCPYLARNGLTILAAVFFASLPFAARAEQAPPEQAAQIAPDLSQPSSAALDIRLAPAPEVRDELPALPTIDLTTKPDDLWQRVRNGFGMPDLASPLVADRQAWYLNRPDMLQRIFERSRKYLYHIVVELEKRGMPTELALLPIVESSFNPLAYSRARALGIWQFIPSTGKTYNLKQNWWLDERRDILASTSAALDYLQFIYEMNGDWHLALASYNWGENAVARAVAKNQAKGLPTDYGNLTMPGETRYYVPKLQAIKNIVAHPELFGFRLDSIPNKPYFATVDMDESVDIATAAKLAETSLEEFIALNPAYHRPVIQGTNKAPLVIPADKMQAFRDNLARYEREDRPLTAWRTYQLKKGEKIDAVANRFGLSLARLKQLNGIAQRAKIVPGQNFLVPAAGRGVPHEQLAAALPKIPGDPPKAAPVAKGAKKKPAGAQKSAGTRPHAKSKGQPVKKAAPAKGKKRKH